MAASTFKYELGGALFLEDVPKMLNSSKSLDVLEKFALLFW